MAKEKQKIMKPDYDFLFSCLDYNSEKVNAYFEKNINAILENLEKETSLFNNAVESIFEYTNNESDSLYQEIKKLNEKTYREFNAYEKMYANKRNYLENSDNSEVDMKKEELNKYLNKANKIKEDFRYRRFLLEQGFKTKNQELLAKYDDDYKIHLNSIFKFKETILNINDEHYKRAESILIANQELIDKMEDAIKHYKTTPSEYESSNELLLSLENRIRIFENELNDTKEIELDDALKNNKSFSSNIENNYEEFSKSLDSRREYIRLLLLKANNEHEEFRNKMQDNLTSMNKMLDDAYNEYKASKNKKMVKVIKREKFLFDQKIKYELQKEATLFNAKERILNNYLIQIDRLDNRSNLVNEKVKLDYTYSYKANFDLHEKMIPDFKDIITGIKHDLAFAKNNIKSIISPVDEIKHSFDIPVLNTKLNVLKNMQAEINKSLNIAKELDDLAFEILAMQPIIEIKQLELQNQYLTIDDSTELNISILKLNLEEYKLLEEIGLEIKCIKQNITNLRRAKELKLNTLDMSLKKDLLTISSYNRVEILKQNQKIVTLNDNKYANLNDLLYKYNIKKIMYLSKKNRQAALSKYALLLLKEKNEIREDEKIYNASLKKFNEEKEAQLRQVENVTQIERINFNKRLENIDINLNKKISYVKKNINIIQDLSNFALSGIYYDYDMAISERVSKYHDVRNFLVMYLKSHDEIMSEVFKPLLTINIDGFEEKSSEKVLEIILTGKEENVKSIINTYLIKRVKLASDNNIKFTKDNHHYLNRYTQIHANYFTQLTRKLKKGSLNQKNIALFVLNYAKNIKHFTEVMRKDFIKETLNQYSDYIISLIENNRCAEINRKKDISDEVLKAEEKVCPMNFTISELIKQAEKEKTEEIARFEVFKEKVKLTTNNINALYDYNVNKLKREHKDFLYRKNTIIDNLNRDILIVLEKIDAIELMNNQTNDQNFKNNDKGISNHLSNYIKKVACDIEEELGFVSCYDDLVTESITSAQNETNNFDSIMTECLNKYKSIFKQNCAYQEYFTKKRERQLNIDKLELKKTYPTRIKECREMYRQEIEKKNNTFKAKIYENYLTKLDFNKNFNDNVNELERTSSLIASTNAELVKKDELTLNKYQLNPSYKLKYRTPNLISSAVNSQNKENTKEKE